MAMCAHAALPFRCARATAPRHRGHSSHVTNVCWTANDTYVLSTGGGENSVFQWKLVPADPEVDVSVSTKSSSKGGGPKAMGNGGPVSAGVALAKY